MARIESLVEREVRELSLRLPLTNMEVGVNTGRHKTHPVFPYHIKEGEWHKMGNLLFSGNPCSETGSVELTFKTVEDEDHQISLDKLRLEGDILYIGDKGSVAARVIKGERRDIVMLEMSMYRGICMDMVSPKNKQSSVE